MTNPGRLRISVGGIEQLLHVGRTVTLGRDPACDITVEYAKASRFHCRVLVDPAAGWVFEDAGSSNGSFVGGRRIRRTVIAARLTVHLGHPALGEEVVLAPEDDGAGRNHARPAYPLGRSLRIGRGPDNDIVVEDLQASRRHAEVVTAGSGQTTVVDAGSHNGTFVNGRRVVRATLEEGDVIGVGRHAFHLRDGVLREQVDSGGVRFEAAALSFRTPEGQTILNDVSFVLEPSSLLAVMGPAGAGKSTLMKALIGSQPATSGRVYYGDLDFYAAYEELRSRVGYVPQEDILHSQLRLRQALRFAADLRFPADSRPEDRAARVDEVLGELGLRQRADLAIAKLSGGQRKRTNVAQELLTKPSLLLLDEPTTGLDPGLVKSMMELFRELADNGRTVVVITHSLQSIELCDRVLMLAPGGRTSYLGPPAEMLGYFGRTENADVFQDLERADVDWPERFKAHHLHRKYVAGPSSGRSTAPAGLHPPAPSALQPWPDQLRTLARRQVAVLSADRRNFLFLVLGVLLPGLAVLALVHPGALNLSSAPHPDARMLLLALVVAATCAAAANGLREIVKELPIYDRDRAAGMSIRAYVGAKFLVLGVVTVVQVCVLVAIGTASSQGTPSARAAIVVALALAAVGALALGLLISSLVGTSEKAMALIAVLFVGEWLFSGGAVNLDNKPPMQAVGYVTSANWGLAAAASATDLARLEQRCVPGQPALTAAPIEPPPCDRRWRQGLIQFVTDLGALIALIVATGVAVYAALRRKDARSRAP